MRYGKGPDCSDFGEMFIRYMVVSGLARGNTPWAVPEDRTGDSAC